MHGQPQYGPPTHMPPPAAPNTQAWIGVTALLSALAALVLAIYQALPLPNGASPAPLVSIATFILSIVALAKARRRPSQGGVAAFALIASIAAFIVGAQASKEMQARHDYQRQVVNCIITNGC
ncbi:hypothetical protein ABZ897_00905 [Nonomuraea sp. NPDC046802]|uniref:hypothetical protein n=1 Tax=Nonomuraea sp. NPDC046802 TaxID=3154919 RepID=UPI0033FA6D37